MARAAKKTRTAAVKTAPTPVPVKKPLPGWLLAVMLFAGALAVVFVIYGPSLNGDFVFDDRTLPMLRPDAPRLRLRYDWLGARPLLMLTYWANYQLGGLDTTPYHAVNVVLHAACAVLIFFIVKRILEWGAVPEKTRFGAALFGAALFLVHPVQTEAVSYIASRSETLSVFLFLGAFTLFLYRRKTAIGIPTALGILVLYLGAMTSKEHTAMLPAVLLLTDYFWNPGFSLRGVWRNWKLYIPIAMGAAAGGLLFVSYIRKGSNAGFALKDFTWYQYLFTQCRALFVYFRLFLFPYGQSVDYAFPVSHNLLEYGAVFYGVALLALIGCAIYFRKRYPIACYGFLMALLLFAPTSSVVPIKDTLAERRMYLPFLGLVLITCDFATRIKLNRQVLVAAEAAICIVLAVVTYQRNGVWISMESLWHDAYRKNPENPRALMGLADGYAAQGKCGEAVPYFQKAVELAPDYHNVYNLASAYDCAGEAAEALTGYQNALKVKPTAEAWVHIALLQMKKGQYDDAYRSLDTAQHVTNSYLDTYNYRGILDLAESRFDHAEGQFKTVLSVDPANAMALRGLNRAQNHVRQF
jgi:tetratricopeptide (TPR) repeat protein